MSFQFDIFLDQDEATSGSEDRPLIPMSYQDSGVPLPTLYDGGAQGEGRRPRMGAIEFLLYNMASMLASVAAGYDVRISNVSPMHPDLLPKRWQLYLFKRIKQEVSVHHNQPDEKYPTYF